MEIDGSKADGATSSSYSGRWLAISSDAVRLIAPQLIATGTVTNSGERHAGGSGDKTTIQVMLGELSSP